MSAPDIANARNADLRHAGAALRRAASAARRTAIQTGTDLIIVEDGALMRISAEQLLRESAEDARATR